jgi:hypothetical protein
MVFLVGRLFLGVALALAMLTASASAATSPLRAEHRCAAGSKHALIGGKHACLKPGARCQARHASQYRRHGYVCRSGRLARAKPAPPAAPPQADIALTVTGSPDPVGVGQPLVYTITVANKGPATPERVVAGTEQLADEINGGSLEVVSAEEPCRVSLGVIACAFTSIPPGGSVTARVTVRPKAAGTLQAHWEAGPADLKRTEDRNVSDNAVDVATVVR